MAERGWMDPDRVESVADQLETMADILRVVNRVLETQIKILQTTAFIGNVGGAVWARYLEILQPVIKELEEKSRKLSERAKNEAKEWKRAAGIG